MVMLVFAGISIVAAVVLDSFFKFRMTKLGHKWVFLKGGTFDYKEYHHERLEQGWAAWPVYLMWALWICGLALLIGGSFAHFGTKPPR
jgi:hypothetical protein